MARVLLGLPSNYCVMAPSSDICSSPKPSASVRVCHWWRPVVLVCIVVNDVVCMTHSRRFVCVLRSMRRGSRCYLAASDICVSESVSRAFIRPHFYKKRSRSQNAASFLSMSCAMNIRANSFPTRIRQLLGCAPWSSVVPSGAGAEIRRVATR